MSTTVAPLGLRLFLEGIEVPVVSAQVNISPDQPSMAAIQIIPSDTALHLLPRTLVHLFYLDNEVILTGPPKKSASGGTGDINLSNRFDAPDSQYKILFTGEVIGFNYSKTSDSRQLVLQCMDLSSYWDTCYQWYVDYSVGGNGLTDKSHIFVGAGQSEFNSVSGGTQWVLGNILTQSPSSPEYKDLKGLLGGIVHLLEMIGGLRYKSSGEPGFNGVNDFFTIAELRYNLLGMVGAVEKDTTSATMFEHIAFLDWVRNGMTSLGNLLSFRDIINHTCQYIYHHVYPNPCAYFSTGQPTSALVPVPNFMDTTKGHLAFSYIKQAVNSFTTAWGNISVNPPVVNNIPMTYGATKKGGASLDAASRALTEVTTADAPSVKAKIDEAIGCVKAILSLFQQMGFKEGLTGVPINNEGDLATQMNAQFVKISTSVGTGDGGILSSTYRAQNATQKSVQSATGTHLYSQLLLPETFFISPPKCNVLFADQYYQFSFSRNFMREVTRLSCQAGLEFFSGGTQGNSDLLSTAYYAPNIKDVRETTMQLTMSKGSTILLPHEVHCGIIPKFEWVSDGQRWGAKEADAAGTLDQFYDSGQVGFIQRLANFQFFLHRWSSRTMSVAGIFNPNLVLGLPGLVMDRSMPALGVIKTLEKNLGKMWLPVQYLGKIVYISHSIHQQGGGTTVSYSHCRVHRGADDEFLGVLIRDVVQTANKKVTLKFNVKPLFGDSNNTSKVSVIPMGETDLPAQSVGDLRAVLGLYLSNLLTPNIPVSDPKSFRGATVLKVVPTGKLKISDKDFGLLNVTDRSAISRVPEVLEVEFNLKVKTGKYDRVSRSIEQVLTPPWYSDVWTNEKIGESVYKPLLGTEAITDKVEISAKEQSKIIDQNVSDDAALQLAAASESEYPPEKNPFSFYSDETSTDTVLTAAPGSIEEAVDSLTILYSMLKLRGADMHSFIQQYTRRPIATLEQVLGSANLKYDDSGLIDPTIKGPVIEGFHSRAFGDYNKDVKYPIREDELPQAGKDALKALFPGATPPGAAVKRGNLFNRAAPELEIISYYDPRGRSQARVQAYVEELRISRGLMG